MKLENGAVVNISITGTTLKLQFNPRSAYDPNDWRPVTSAQTLAATEEVWRVAHYYSEPKCSIADLLVTELHLARGFRLPSGRVRLRKVQDGPDRSIVGNGTVRRGRGTISFRSGSATTSKPLF